MKAGKFNGCRITTPHNQRGMVLIIALIILVAMTLAGIGMMRSVDTGSMIAGNLAFRQATLNVSDAGTSAAFNALMAVANSNNTNDKAILNYDGNNTQPCSNAPGATAVVAGVAVCTGGNISFPGYFSSPINACEVTGALPCATNWWTIAANWAGAPTVAVPDVNTTVQYLIHRMCQTPNSPPNTTAATCQTYMPPVTGGSHTPGAPMITSPPIYYYRITVRVTGPRNTVSVVQAMVQQP